jgi:hypothetical protein
MPSRAAESFASANSKTRRLHRLSPFRIIALVVIRAWARQGALLLDSGMTFELTNEERQILLLAIASTSEREIAVIERLSSERSCARAELHEREQYLKKLDSLRKRLFRPH